VTTAESVRPSTSAYDRSTPPDAGGVDVWQRLVVGWHLGFWLVLALAVARSVVSPELEAAGRWRALALLGVLAATYLATVQRRTIRQDRAAALYLVVAIAVTGLAAALAASLAMLLFIVYAQTWLLSESRRQGTAFSVALTLAVTVGLLVSNGWTWEALRAIGPQMLVSLVFSLLLGFWISRIIDQSRERADLIAQLEQARARLAASERANGVAAERERVAREIHDTLAQGFTSIVMLAQTAAPLVGRDPSRAVAQLATIEEVARDNLAEARALVAASAPAGLDGTTLPDAVRRLTERFARETGVAVNADVDPVSTLDPDRQVVVLRAVQESLSNVRRHARAGRVGVRLHEDGEGALAQVRDDGIGFSTQAPRPGYGLEGMRSRAREVGGELDVASTPGGGTVVTLRFPR
jgi:signal transduction histidine kinase